MEPWQSWLLAIGLGGVAAAYYSQGKDKPKVATAHRSSTALEQPDSGPASKRKQSKQKAAATPGKSILVDSATSKARQEKADKGGSTHQRGPSVTFGADDNDNDEAVAQDDQDWARQLEANRKGVAISSAAKSSNTSKKQNKKNEETHSKPVAAANDVSDMLEPATPARSSIRITGEEKAKNKKATVAAPVQQETKKQRQNRRKAEEKKAHREQDEKERQVLLEQQRRTARESRGEPARNGVSTSQTSTAWSAQSATNGVTAAPAVAPATQLLDTFEPDSASTSTAADLPTPAGVSSTVGQDLPSEETQMEMLNELNGWAEVPSKSKKNKHNKKAGNGITASDAAAPLPPPQAPAKAENKFANISTSELVGGKKGSKKNANTNGFAALDAATDFVPTAKSHPQDSDWAAN